MSRNIDWSQPLSEEDRKWAEQFPMMAPLIEANDSEFAKPAEDGSAGDSGGSEEEAVDYGELTVAQLQAEIERRNAEFGTTMSTKGKRDELIARLQEDDEAAGAEGASL